MQNTPLELGTDRQLLFDQLFFDEKRGVNLEVCPPRQEFTPVLQPDQPWENRGVCCYNTVRFEDGRFRMWYDTIAREGRHGRRYLGSAKHIDPAAKSAAGR